MNNTITTRTTTTRTIGRRAGVRATVAAAAGAAALCVAIVPAHATTTSSSSSATVSTPSTNRTVSYVGHGNQRPNYQGLDLNGDHVSDVWTYCVEPGQQQAQGVSNGTQSLTHYDLSGYAVQDAGRLRWVLQHGFGGQSAASIASTIGVNISGVDQARVAEAMQAATQSAVWLYSSGYHVTANFRYDTRTVSEAQVVSAVFTRTYAWLVEHATQSTGTTWVWDSRPGQSASQGLAQVPTTGGSTSTSRS